jgi:uncharacterized phage protein (TIGR02218 family)
MHILSSSFSDHIRKDHVTLAQCWVMRRRDGDVIGFTDHDRDLTLPLPEGAVLCQSLEGWQGQKQDTEIGLTSERQRQMSNAQVAGVLGGPALREEDLLAGRYDGASIRRFLVNWADTAVFHERDAALLGDIRRAEGTFIAQLLSPASRLDEERGRLYTRTCSADLGDARCGITLDAPLWQVSGVVEDSDGALHVQSAALASYPADQFSDGLLTWTLGANAGLTAQVRSHRTGGHLSLWQRSPALIEPGDSFTIHAGCPKTFEACRDTFNNSLNFRGFPHMPGNDFLLFVPGQGESGLDGGSLFSRA